MGVTDDRCYRAAHCAVWDPVKGPGHVFAGPFCLTDHVHILRAVSQTPYIRLQLAMAVGQKDSGGDGRGSRSVYPAIPIRVDIDAMMRQMDKAVDDWAAVVCMETGMSYPAKFGPRASMIRANLDSLYAAPGYVITRWVSAHKVSALPESVEGSIAMSGEAIVWFEANGAFGAVELLTLYRKACKLLRIDPEA